MDISQALPAVGLFLVVGVVVLVAIAGLLFGSARRERLESAYMDLLAQHGLSATDAPLGLADHDLERFDLLPKGDRDRSAVWGMAGEVSLDLGGTPATGACAAFEWWWENESTSVDAHGHRHTRYDRRSLLAVLLRVPGTDQPWIRWTGEGILTRLGIGGRGDLQLESEAFNRAFDVRSADRELAVRLLDAQMQQALLERYRDVSVDVRGDLILVTTDAPRRAFTGTFRREGPTGLAALFSRGGDLVSSDPAVLDAILSARRRALELIGSWPAGYWRGLRHRQQP